MKVFGIVWIFSRISRCLRILMCRVVCFGSCGRSRYLELLGRIILDVEAVDVG